MSESENEKVADTGKASAAILLLAVLFAAPALALAAPTPSTLDSALSVATIQRREAPQYVPGQPVRNVGRFTGVWLGRARAIVEWTLGQPLCPAPLQQAPPSLQQSTNRLAH